MATNAKATKAKRTTKAKGHRSHMTTEERIASQPGSVGWLAGCQRATNACVALLSDHAAAHGLTNEQVFFSAVQLASNVAAQLWRTPEDIHRISSQSVQGYRDQLRARHVDALSRTVQ